MTYKCNFEILKQEKVKIIGQRFVIKGTLNRKVCSSCPRASTINEDHRLKMTILKENFCWPQEHFFHIFLIKSHFLHSSGFFQCRKRFYFLFLIFAVLNKCFLISFKIVILSLWSSFIVEALWRPEPTFMFNVPLIINICSILFTAERDVFNFSIFKISKIHL